MSHEVNRYLLGSVQLSGLTYSLQDTVTALFLLLPPFLNFSFFFFLQSLYLFISSVSQKLKSFKRIKAFAPVYRMGIWTNYKPTYSGSVWVSKGKMEVT